MDYSGKRAEICLMMSGQTIPPAVSLNKLNFILAGLNIELSPVEFLCSVAIPTRALKEHL